MEINKDMFCMHSSDQRCMYVPAAVIHLLLAQVGTSTRPRDEGYPIGKSTASSTAVMELSHNKAAGESFCLLTVMLGEDLA